MPTLVWKNISSISYLTRKCICSVFLFLYFFFFSVGKSIILISFWVSSLWFPFLWSRSQIQLVVDSYRQLHLYTRWTCKERRPSFTSGKDRDKRDFLPEAGGSRFFQAKLTELDPSLLPTSFLYSNTSQSSFINICSIISKQINIINNYLVPTIDP